MSHVPVSLAETRVPMHSGLSLWHPGVLTHSEPKSIVKLRWLKPRGATPSLFAHESA